MDDSSLIIRQVQAADLNFLCDVAKQAGVGFTSFPDDFAYLNKKLQRSLNSFASQLEHKSGLYLLVMEDLAAQQNIGICGIEGTAGAGQPFYTYKLDLTDKSICLVSDFKQASEVGSLFLDARYRGHKYGEFLSRSRFLFIAEHPNWFYNTIIAEIRGVIEKNTSPFWEEVDKKFFAMEYTEAEFLKPKDHQFIAEHAAKQPIYLDSLSKKAKDVIGQANTNSKAAKRILETEGFFFSGYLDVFNAGPVMQVNKNHIKTIQNSKSAILVQCREINDGQDAMVCATKNGFRLIRTKFKLIDANQVAISQKAAANLMIGIGDRVRYA